MTYQCDHCGESVIPIDGMNAIWDRGYWWHASCCRLSWKEGQAFVDFPSDGKLCPESVLQPQP